MFGGWRRLGEFAQVSNVRACGVLWLIAESARDETLAGHATSDYGGVSDGDSVAVVLCGRDNAQVGCRYESGAVWGSGNAWA